MIVRMKKVSAVCLASETESALRALRELGALHLVHVREPAGDRLDERRRQASRAALALRLLSRAAPLPGDAPQATAQESPPLEPLLDRILAIEEARRTAQDGLDALRAEQRELEPLGDFDPALARDLTARGIHVRLYRTAGRRDVQYPAGAIVRPLDSHGNVTAVISRDPADLELSEVPMPRRRLSQVTAEIAAGLANVRQAEHDLRRQAKYIALLRAHVDRLAEEQAFETARSGMGQDGSVAYLQGFCPADAVDAIRQAAGRHGWATLVQEPSAEDRIPTLLRNPAWVRPIEAVFSTIKILPGYREADVSVAFLVFLSLFFAMIVGDAGYGLVFLLLTWFAGRRAKRSAPREPFRLMTLFSVCTVAWGVLTGVYFGIADLPAPLQALRIDWLTDNLNIMHLCLLISAVHLSVAHLWNLVRFVNSLRAVAQAGWIAVTWCIFFLARRMIIGLPLPSCFGLLLGGGLLAVVLFMTPLNKLKEEWVNHLMLPLTLMSNFGDVLSYLRLFALGIAGMKLAGAFNTMALSMGFSSILTGLIAALILFAGHSLNIMLSAISVLVHGVRLNALEFSMHFGLEWTGFPYDPFAGKASIKPN